MAKTSCRYNPFSHLQGTHKPIYTTTTTYMYCDYTHTYGIPKCRDYLWLRLVQVVRSRRKVYRRLWKRTTNIRTISCNAPVARKSRLGLGLGLLRPYHLWNIICSFNLLNTYYSCFLLLVLWWVPKEKAWLFTVSAEIHEIEHHKWKFLYEKGKDLDHYYGYHHYHHNYYHQNHHH